jgi:hypothetical protein
MEQEMAAAADEDHCHIQGEDTQRREGYHGRDMLGEHLHDASDEWKRRQAAGEWRSPPVFLLLFFAYYLGRLVLSCQRLHGQNTHTR